MALTSGWLCPIMTFWKFAMNSLEKMIACAAVAAAAAVPVEGGGKAGKGRP